MTENHRATTVGDEHGRISPELLFPWSDGDGLTAVLRDPRLWAAAFEYPAARRLIKMEHLLDALAWTEHLEELADELWVDLDTLMARLDGLTPEERAQIAELGERVERGA